MSWFISEQYLRENTIIGESIQAADVRPHIRTSAKAYVQKLLGTYFFEYMLNLYDNGGTNAAEDTLMVFITDAVGYRLAQRFGTISTFKLTEKGYQKQNGTNSESLSLEEVEKIESQYHRDADMYEQLLIDYLWANRASYASFTSNLNNDSQIKKDCGGTERSGSYFDII